MGCCSGNTLAVGLESRVSGLWREPALWDGFFFIVSGFHLMIYWGCRIHVFLAEWKKSEKTERMRSMKLLQGIRTLVLAGILTMAGTSGVLAEYTAWQDTDYDFSQVKTVYLSDMDMSGYRLTSGTKAQKMLQDYRKKAGKVKGVKVLLAPAVQVRALLPGEEKKQAPEGAGIGAGPEKNGEIQSAAKGERKAAVIPQEALDAGAQLVHPGDPGQLPGGFLPGARPYGMEDEGNRRQLPGRPGKLAYLLPDCDLSGLHSRLLRAYASVTVRFLWFDTKTGKLVASSEDARVRDSENDPLGVYNRIIDRFFKNLKETVKK